MQMLCRVLLLLPAGLQAQEAFTPVNCDRPPLASGDGFDELALLQQDLTPASGMHAKSTQEWAAHYSDHKSKILAEQRVVDDESFGGQLSKLNSGICADDPLWRDGDGDGCEIYSFAIRSGKTTRELACNGGGEIPGDDPATRNMRLRGKRTEVVADATAMIFCPLTCGLCEPEQRENVTANASAARATNTSALAANVSSDELNDTGVDLEDDPSNPQTFLLQMGLSSPSYRPEKKSPNFWAEHAYDHKSKITPDAQVLDNETVSHGVALLQKGDGCVDDPLWRDADGDGCEIYRFAIESGKVSREAACGGGGEQRAHSLRGSGQTKRFKVVADATAKVFCPVTCRVC